MHDMIGKQFGKWTLLEYIGRDNRSEQIFKATCSCGTIKNHRLSSLRSAESTQCKACYSKQNFLSETLVGKVFGLWTVVEKIKNEKRNEWEYKCRCECGREKLVQAYDLKKGKSTRCPSCRNKTHGMSYTKTYKIWQDLFVRCYDSKSRFFHRYGGRGIIVCERWHTFENFLADMGIRPDKLQIDRINNDGNYEPSNCRWVTHLENNRNRNNSRNKKEK